MTPPAGQGVAVLFPNAPNPPISGTLFGSLALTGGTNDTSGLTTGYFSAVGNGGSGGIGLGKATVSRSVDPSPTGTISDYILPGSIDPTKVTKVWAIVSGSKTDEPFNGLSPVTYVPTSYDLHALINLVLSGPPGGPFQVPGPINNTFLSYGGYSQTIVLAPIADGGYWDPADVVYEALALTATLESTVYGRINSNWGGTMTVVVWYNL